MMDFYKLHLFKKLPQVLQFSYHLVLFFNVLHGNTFCYTFILIPLGFHWMHGYICELYIKLSILIVFNWLWLISLQDLQWSIVPYCEYILFLGDFTNNPLNSASSGSKTCKYFMYYTFSPCNCTKKFIPSLSNCEAN